MSSLRQDKQYMQRAFELALRGIGKTAPNPLVGCVIVNNGHIIGEGWHQEYGKSHAEVNALNSIINKETIEGATVYVNLEPCSFEGHTPACATLLASLPIGRLVISTRDPHPKVNGEGLSIIRKNGIEITEGILEEEGRFLNRRFLCFHLLKRPYILLKWAQTSDGFIARKNFDSKWISNTYSRKLVHRWRSEEASILVGANTVRQDDPELTVRDWAGKNPLRIVLDPSLSLSKEYNIFTKGPDTWVFNSKSSTEEGNTRFIKIDADNFLSEVLHYLYKSEIQSVLIEGGAFVHSEFIKAGLWDEIRVFESEQRFEEGISAPIMKGNASNNETVMGDKLLTYFNEKWQKN